jgi:enoyl-[acyl-carrier protein] reductase I
MTKRKNKKRQTRVCRFFTFAKSYAIKAPMNTLQPLPLLQGKTGLIMGVANEMSLAWGIAQAAKAAGAKLILTYPNATLEKRVRPLAEQLGAACYPCDVQADSQFKTLRKALEDDGITLDFMVHAVAFANKEELKGGISSTTREGFNLALDVSCYSLIAMMQHFGPLLSRSASVVALTYDGAVRVVPNYNVMGVAKAALEAAVRYLAAEFGLAGVRVNAISAGPVKTLAASGIGEFKSMLSHHEATAPLKRLTTQEDVAGAALYLLSEFSGGVTGEVHYVDGGMNILGATPPKQNQ